MNVDWDKMYPPIAGRLRKKPMYVVTDSGCWEWGWARNDQGYGMCDPRHFGVPDDFPRNIKSNGQHRAFAHRVSYEVNVGPVPADKCVLHSCDNPSCINPAHLRLGTRTDNAQDRVERGRTTLGKERLDFCKRGHDYNDPANVRWYADGKRRKCRACARILAAEARARR